MSKLKYERNQQSRTKQQNTRKLEKRCDPFTAWKVQDEYDDCGGIEEWIQRRNGGSGKRDYGRRAVISKELEQYLTNPKYLCSEIHDFQKFLSESRPGLPQKVHSKISTATEKGKCEKFKGTETKTWETNVQTKDKGVATQNVVKRPKATLVSEQPDKPSQTKADSKTQDQPRNSRSQRASGCYSSGTIASRAKRMLDPIQRRNKNTEDEENNNDLKRQSQSKPHGSEQQPVVNVNNISLDNSSQQLIPSKFKYSQGSVLHGSSNSLGSIIFHDVPSDDDTVETRKRTPISLDEINLCPPQIPSIRKSSNVSIGETNLKRHPSDNYITSTVSSTKDHKHHGDENNNYQNHSGFYVDPSGMTVSTFRTSSGSTNLELRKHGGLGERLATLSPKTAQRQAQLVLKRVCLLDTNIQDRKTISRAQQMIQNRAKTAASSAKSTTVTPRPSTSSVTTLSLDGTVLDEHTGSSDKLTSRSGISGLEGYMNSYYREKTNPHQFQIGDLLPAVDDHSNKNNKPKRKDSNSNNRTNEGDNFPVGEDYTYSQMAKNNCLHHEDKIFMAKEGVELVRVKEQQQSYLGPPAFRPFSHKTPLHRAKEITQKRLGQPALNAVSAQDSEGNSGRNRWQSSAGTLYAKVNGHDEIVGRLETQAPILESRGLATLFKLSRRRQALQRQMMDIADNHASSVVTRKHHTRNQGERLGKSDGS